MNTTDDSKYCWSVDDETYHSSGGGFYDAQEQARTELFELYDDESVVGLEYHIARQLSPEEYLADLVHKVGGEVLDAVYPLLPVNSDWDFDDVFHITEEIETKIGKGVVDLLGEHGAFMDVFFPKDVRTFRIVGCDEADEEVL